MRFLVDECTGPAVAEWLRSIGHDVFSIYHQARGVDDEAVLALAVEQDRILITNDKGFGEKIVREGKAHHGVVLLRLDDERSVAKIWVLDRLLKNHAQRLDQTFVVATETKVRFLS